MENIEKPILSIIQDIKSGLINPQSLDQDIRRQIVEALLFEGYGISQIAQILNKSEKTIRRDVLQIRERNSLNPSPELAKQLIGELHLKSEIHWSSLMRIARSQEGSVGDRIQANYLAWKVVEEKNKLLQTLGYLPLKPKEYIADFIHHIDHNSQEKSYEEIKEVLKEVLTTAEEAGTATPELKQNINILNIKIEKEKINYEACGLLEQQKQLINKEAHNEK